eukprot:2677537-Prymnesium_polylepis.1
MRRDRSWADVAGASKSIDTVMDSIEFQRLRPRCFRDLDGSSDTWGTELRHLVRSVRSVSCVWTGNATHRALRLRFAVAGDSPQGLVAQI